MQVWLEFRRVLFRSPVPGNMACLTGPAPAAGKHPRHGNVWGSDRSSRWKKDRSMGWLFLWQNPVFFEKNVGKDQLQLQCWKVDEKMIPTFFWWLRDFFWLRPLDFVPKFCPQLEVVKFVVSICKGPSNLRLKCLRLVLPQSTPRLSRKGSITQLQLVLVYHIPENKSPPNLGVASHLLSRWYSSFLFPNKRERYLKFCEHENFHHLRHAVPGKPFKKVRLENIA